MSRLRFLACVAAVLALAPAGEYVFGESVELTAGPRQDLFADPDGDLVPNCIEWLMQTDVNLADTDDDQREDFEEILTFTSHDPNACAKPVDHAMRVLVTSNRDALGHSEVYLHLMMRFVNLPLDEINFRDFYVDMSGTRISLLRLIGGGVRVVSRQSPTQGTMFLFSFRFASEEDLKRIMPCTIGATAFIANQYFNTGCYVMEAGDDVAVLMPFSGGNLALQPVSSNLSSNDGDPYYRGGGRVCEMALEQIGSSSKGALCEVAWARCKPAPGLQCSISCPQKTGRIVTIPDGLGTITGR